MGNTPTCVGKTPDRKRAWLFLQKHPHVRGEDGGPFKGRGVGIRKHPHVRGEDGSKVDFVGCESETPPRAWGRHGLKTFISENDGNTPTCVGKTKVHLLLRTTQQKHPHVRGEDALRSIADSRCLETPPRAWGRPQPASTSAAASRNTPTCVGKTLRDYSLFLLSRQNNIETSSFSDTSCSPDNSMSWRFGSPMP